MTDNVKIVEKDPKPTTNSLYTKAEAELRTKHQAEFDTILDRLYAEAGMTRKKRLSAAEREAVKEEARRQKAAEALVKMRAEFPDLFEGSPLDETSEPADILRA